MTDIAITENLASTNSVVRIAQNSHPIIAEETRREWAKAITKQLCESWGWQEDEPEAVLLGLNIAYGIDQMTAGTRTSPHALLQGLLPLGAV